MPRIQVIESYRKDGKVKQRIICNLNRYPTIEQAIEGETASLETLKELSGPPRRLLSQYGRAESIPPEQMRQFKSERAKRLRKQHARIKQLRLALAQFPSTAAAPILLRRGQPASLKDMVATLAAAINSEHAAVRKHPRRTR